MDKVDNPVTLITGTSRGIGRALVEHYISLGHSVIGCSRGSVDYSYDNYKHFQCDVTDEKNILEIFKHIRKTYNKLDNLINNAGIDSSNLAMLTSTDSFDEVMNINTRGTFIFSREAANLMIKNKYGRIVNFTSVSVPTNTGGKLSYNVSKAAIEMLTKTLASELAKYNITVNAIGPSVTDTDMLNNRNNLDKILKQVYSQVIIQDYSTIQDICNVVDFFLKKESNHITAQTIYLCGAV